ASDAAGTVPCVAAAATSRSVTTRHEQREHDRQQITDDQAPAQIIIDHTLPVGLGALAARSELRDELPGQRWNEGLQAIISRRDPVIDARRRVRAIERARFDWITRHAPCEVVADVFLTADRRRRDVVPGGNRAAIVLGVLKVAGLPAHHVVTPRTRAI